jgi:hypothetical protein
VLNPPSKRNQADPRRALLTIPPLKIVVQTAALLPDSGLGVSNYLFCLKTHPGPNTAMFFTAQPQEEALVFSPLWPGFFSVFSQDKTKGKAV